MNTATATERVHLARRILAGVERLDKNGLDRWTAARLGKKLAELERTTLADAVLDDLAALARRLCA